MVNYSKAILCLATLYNGIYYNFKEFDPAFNDWTRLQMYVHSSDDIDCTHFNFHYIKYKTIERLGTIT